MTQGGAAFPVVASTDPPAAGPAQRVVVVSDGRPVQAGPAQRVVVVTDGRPVQGNAPIPVVVATGAQASQVLAGPPIPVVVVIGSLGGVPVNSVLPAISGTVAIGQTLTATTGTWSNSPTGYTYQWNRDGVAIGGETASTYLLTASDPGTVITVTVTASNAAGSASATSAGTAVSSLLTSVVAFWKLEEASGTRVDATGRGNDLAPTNTPGNAAGKIGNAISLLPASTQYASIADTADLSMGAGVRCTFAGWFNCTDMSAVRMIFSKFTPAGNQREYRLYVFTDGSVHFGVSSNGTASFEAATGAGVVTAGNWYYFAAWYDGSNIKVQINNGTVFSTAFSADIFNGTSPFQLGQETAETLKMNGLIDALGIWKRVLSAAELTANYNGGAGVQYPFEGAGSAFTLLPAMLADNGYTTDLTNYYLSNPFARVLAQTTATSMWLSLWDNLHSSYPTFDQVNVRVNGADHAQINPSADGASLSTIALPGGDQTVEIVASLQSKPAATVLGSFLKAAWFNGPAVLSQPTSSRLLVYGDSIAVGANASVPSRDGWAVLLRNYRGVSVSTMVEGWGFRSLYDDALDAPTRAAFVARLAGYSPSVIWLAIGTNDYGLNKWSAASFGTAYAALLDDLHTALPSAVIYCQTPILRVAPASEAANGSGSTLGNYRTQIATAQAARSGYCVLVDGTAILAAGASYDADGIHPTTAGHATYYAAVKAALGI